MITLSFNCKHKEVLDSILLEIPGKVAGTIFGNTSYSIKETNCLYLRG